MPKYLDIRETQCISTSSFENPQSGVLTENEHVSTQDLTCQPLEEGLDKFVQLCLDGKGLPHAALSSQLYKRIAEEEKSCHCNVVCSLKRCSAWRERVDWVRSGLNGSTITLPARRSTEQALCQRRRERLDLSQSILQVWSKVS